jgi:hypothetical protein
LTTAKQQNVAQSVTQPQTAKIQYMKTLVRIPPKIYFNN